MKIRLLLAAAAVVLAANGATPPGNKLSNEQKILHVLDRLTFGARPGDFEEVRRVGVEKSIELQLHPERIAENPALELRLKPLDTIRMETAEIFSGYIPAVPARIHPAVRLNELLPGEQFRKVFNGTAEERRAAIMALDPEKRTKVLSAVPSQT